MSDSLAAFLKRTKPAHVVAGERTWPAPVGRRPWENLADICGDVDEVQAFDGEKGLLGVWRRPVQPQTGGPGSELSVLREVMTAQSTMLREVITTQTALIRAIREAAETATQVRQSFRPTMEDDGGEDEDGGEEDGEGAMDRAVAAALGKAMGKVADKVVDGGEAKPT